MHSRDSSSSTASGHVFFLYHMQTCVSLLVMMSLPGWGTCKYIYVATVATQVLTCTYVSLLASFRM